MEIVTFTLANDPFHEPRLGVRIPEDGGFIDLQSGHFAMYERPHPALQSPDAFRDAGVEGRKLAERIAMWVLTQRPPGTIARLDAVRFPQPDGASSELLDQRGQFPE